MKYRELRDEALGMAIPPLVEVAKIVGGDQIRRGIMTVIGWLYAIPLFMSLMLCIYAVVFTGPAATLMSVVIVLMIIVIGLLLYPKVNKFAQRVEDRGGKDPVKALHHPPRAITR